MNTKQLWNALCFNPVTNNYFDGIYSSDTLKDIVDVTNYYFNFPAPQLFSGSACRFCSQGATAVVHGL